MITFLNVSFADKNKASALGARFNMSEKRWFVPDGVDLVPFLHWLDAPLVLSKNVKRTLKRKVK